MKKEKSYFIAAIIGAIFFNICIHFKELTNPYIAYPDAPVLYFLYGLHDKALFAKDFLLQVIGPSLLIPMAKLNPILWLMLSLTSKFSLPNLLAACSIIYNIISVLFIFDIGRRLKGVKSGFFLTALFLIYTATMDSFFGGQSRGIGFVITCATFWILVNKNIPGRKICILLCMSFAFIFYSVILPMVLSVILFAYFDKINIKKNSAVLLLLVLILSFAFFSPYIANLANTLKDFMDWKANLKLDPYGGGFLMTAKNTVFNYVLNMHEHSQLYSFLTGLLLAINAVFLIFRRQKYFEFEERIFISGSLFAFLIIFPIHQGIASRQLIFSVPFFLLITFWRQLSALRNANKIFIWVLAFFLVVLAVFNKYSNELQDYTRYENLFRYMASLPSDITIGGHPETLEFAPLYTKKAVFFNRSWWQLNVFFSERIKDIFIDRRERLLKALYSSDRQKTMSFIKESKIDYFIIEDYYYSSQYLNSPAKWFELPEKNIILKYASKDAGMPKDPVFLKAAEAYGKYFDYGIYLLETKKIFGELKPN